MIRVSHLTKRYGDNLAVSDLSFTIEAGHIYGFLGPNGAGKSTVMNMIAGCLAASEGQVLIDGHDIFEDSIEAKRCIGYLPELPPVYLDMTPREYLSALTMLITMISLLWKWIFPLMQPQARLHTITLGMEKAH